MLFAKYFSCLLYRSDSGGSGSYIPVPRGSTFTNFGDGRGGNRESGWLGRSGKPGFADSLFGVTDTSKPGSPGTFSGGGSGGKRGGFKFGGSAPAFAPQGGGGSGLFGGGSGLFQGGGGGGSSFCIGDTFLTVCRDNEFLADIFLNNDYSKFKDIDRIIGAGWIDVDVVTGSANELMRYLSCQFYNYYAKIIPDSIFINPVLYASNPEAEKLRAGELANRVRSLYTYGRGSGAVYITFNPDGHQLFQYDYNLVAKGFDFDTENTLDYRYRIDTVLDEKEEEYTKTSYIIEVPALNGPNEPVSVDIWCLGAQGGNYLSDVSYNDSINAQYMYGGFGGSIQGRFNILPGTKLKVSLGERGSARRGYKAINGGGAGDGGCTGGGGITYVAYMLDEDTEGNMIIAAGGGGGCFGFADGHIPDPFYIDVPTGSSTQNPGGSNTVAYDVSATDKFWVNDKSIVYVEFMYYTPAELTEDAKAKCVISIQNGLEGTLVDVIDIKPNMGNAQFVYELNQIYAENTPTHEVTIDCVITSKEAMTIGGKVNIRVETKTTTNDPISAEPQYNFKKNIELIETIEDVRLTLKNNQIANPKDFLMIVDAVRIWFVETPSTTIFISNTDEIEVVDTIRNILRTAIVEKYKIGEEITVDEIVRHIIKVYGLDINIRNIDEASLIDIIRDIITGNGKESTPIVESEEAGDVVRIWFE